jgi:hypothetical protein
MKIEKEKKIRLQTAETSFPRNGRLEPPVNQSFTDGGLYFPFLFNLLLGKGKVKKEQPPSVSSPKIGTL